MKKKISLILSILVAFILLQTLPFKFGGAAESIEIFTRLGVEPWGRYLTATLELIAGVLILIPKTRSFGAMVAVVVMTGALLSHIFVLGVFGSQLPLVLMAIFVLLASLFVMKENCKFKKGD